MLVPSLIAWPHCNATTPAVMHVCSSWVCEVECTVGTLSESVESLGRIADTRTCWT
jgi:hypothetical protein